MTDKWLQDKQAADQESREKVIRELIEEAFVDAAAEIRKKEGLISEQDKINYLVNLERDPYPVPDNSVVYYLVGAWAICTVGLLLLNLLY